MLSDSQEKLVVELIQHMESRRRPDEEVIRRKHRAFFAKAFDIALTLDITFGEAGLWRGTAIRTSDQQEFDRYWKSIANDLVAHVRLIRAGVDALHDVGQLPPPGSVHRLAVILRRAKRIELEASLLRSWLEATPRGNSEAYENLITRMFRAEELVARSRQRN